MQVMPKGEWQGVKGDSLVASVLLGMWHSLTPIEGFTDNPAPASISSPESAREHLQGLVSGSTERSTGSRPEAT